MLGNGLHVLGIMSYRILGYVVRCYVVRHYVTFVVMSFGINVAFGIMSHSALCCIRHYVAFGIMLHSDLVVRDCIVRRNVVRPTVGVSSSGLDFKKLI